MILALAGGVGGARLAWGLSQVVGPTDLMVVVNTGDDFEHLGMYISPDLDTVMYTLAGLGNPEAGWGLAQETWAFMAALERLGAPTWFRLGDRDVATHVRRTELLRAGLSLTDVTSAFCSSLGVTHRIVPMTDELVRTHVLTSDGPLEFQEYFVRRQCAPEVRGFEYCGAATARPQANLLKCLSESRLSGVVFCPSNPWLSIAPILAIKELGQAVREAKVPRIAVSPIVGGRAIKGPAAKMMGELGIERSALGIARHYVDLIDGLVIDCQDANLRRDIEALGIRVEVTNTVMATNEDRVALGKFVSHWIGTWA